MFAGIGKKAQWEDDLFQFEIVEVEMCNKENCTHLRNDRVRRNNSIMGKIFF